MPIPSSIRINKYISDSGMCSRRDADRYVENGRVLINDMQAEFGAQVFDGDVVKVDGQLIGQRDETGLVLLVLNKPVGIITSMDESLPDNIGTLIHHSKRIFPVGRLDKDSQGLILLTNHGDMVNKILRAGHDLQRFAAADIDLADPHMVGVRVAHHLHDAARDNILNVLVQVRERLHFGAGEGHCLGKVVVGPGRAVYEFIEPFSA